jgi:pyruvyltransferase
VYGDPASLLPRFHPIRVEPIREFALMPHLADAAGQRFAQRRGLACIEPTWPWQRVVAEIASCRLLLSSSLHGVIVAEAYGVPAIWTAYTKSPEKFHDYYQATGRRRCEPVPWERAVRTKPPDVAKPPGEHQLKAVLLQWLDCDERRKS